MVFQREIPGHSLLHPAGGSQLSLPHNGSSAGRGRCLLLPGHQCSRGFGMETLISDPEAQIRGWRHDCNPAVWPGAFLLGAIFRCNMQPHSTCLLNELIFNQKLLPLIISCAINIHFNSADETPSCVLHLTHTHLPSKEVHFHQDSMRH